MDAESLLKRIRAELVPLYEELVRIRLLLERIERASSDSRAAAAVEGAPEPEKPVPTSQTEPAPEVSTTPARAPKTAAHPSAKSTQRTASSEPVARLDPKQVELLEQLLSLYPGDAAAVFYGFDRQYRCSPEHIDRLAARAGFDTDWVIANRNTLGFLLERFHGCRESIAETLGRDSDSLQALIDRIGMSGQLESVRTRERARLRSAPVAERVDRILFRKRMLQDLGVLEELEGITRQELQHRCAELSGECDCATQVLERLGRECNLDGPKRSRLIKKFDLKRFASDLYREPAEDVRPAAWREGRVEHRQPLGDDDIEARILSMLFSKRKVGAAHTHVDHLVRTVPPHERGRAREIIERLLTSGILVRKVTDNSAEPHVSLAVAAVPSVEERLREVRPLDPSSERRDRLTEDPVK